MVRPVALEAVADGRKPFQKNFARWEGPQLLIEGSLEAKLPTIWTDGKAQVGRVREEKRREEKKKDDQKRESLRRKKIQVREKVGKSQKCSTRDMFIRDVRRSGRWFPERGCILEHKIFSLGKVILHDRCSTSYDLASIFRGRRNTLDRCNGKMAKRIGTRPSALHSTFRFWRTSRRIVSFSTLSSSKTEDVSQNCFVFKLADRQIDR